MAESENKEREPEDFTLKVEKMQSSLDQYEKNFKLKLRLQETTSVHLKYLAKFWEEILWNNYLYGAKEMDYLQLSDINAYLSEWKDEDCFDEAILFKKCRACLKMIDILNFAITVPVHTEEKQRNLWREGIKNLQETVVEKLNYLSYMLLKDGEKYLNPKTENVEYITKDNDDDCLITLCLWANLHMAVRKQGMSALGFSFKLPINIVQENCAVLIIHTLFNQIFPQKLKDKITKDGENVESYVTGDQELSEDVNKVTESMEETFEITEGDNEIEVTDEEQDEAENKNNLYDETENKNNLNDGTENKNNLNDGTENKNNLNDETRNKNNFNDETGFKNVTKIGDKLSIEKENEMSEDEIKSGVSEQTQAKQRLNDINFTAFDPSLLPPLMEPDVQIVDSEEYVVVGGDFHFELRAVPPLNARKGNITYVHREKSVLRRIRYKRKIIPPRIFDGTIPDIATVYEKSRFRHELENAIFVQLQLSNKVMYISTPEPARLFPEIGGYSKDCIFCVDYRKDFSQISFKTNQFGTFGMLQKKFQNLPYKKWSLKAGDTVILSLRGSKLKIDIQVTIEGYTVTFLHPDDNSILSEVDSTWMTSDLLIQKLFAIGVNIVLGENAEKFADISKKEKSLEDNVYDCIALLCLHISFMSVSKFSSSKDEIVLEYSSKKNVDIRRVMIRNFEVIDYDEVKQIEKAKIALERDKDLETGHSRMESLKSETITEDQIIEKNAAEDVVKANGLNQKTKKNPIFHNLYDYVLHEMNETEKETIMNTNASLIENVRTLLKMCRPISSM